MPEIVAVAMLKATAFDQAPFWPTRADPEVALDATVATIWVSLQLTTIPRVLPSQIEPVPRDAPKPEPETVTWVPDVPDVGVKLVMLGGAAIVKLVVVVCVQPPLVAVMVRVDVPAGVEVPVAIVKTGVPEFETELGENEAVAPEGNPLVTAKPMIPV